MWYIVPPLIKIMDLSIKSVAPHVLREHLLPFVANDDGLALELSNKHLKLSCGDPQFDTTP